MQLSLKSVGSKVTFALVCLLTAGVLEAWNLRLYAASREFLGLTVPALQRAVQLDPWNADYDHLLGRSYMYGEQDFLLARVALTRAVSLNPHNARYWLDLASIDQVTGDSSAQEHDLQAAQAAEPTMPDVSWEIANFDLLRGDEPSAFRNLATVEEYSPQLRKQALQLSWRVKPEVDVLLQYVPHTVDPLSAFLSVLYEQHKLPEAAKVWRTLVSLHQPIDPGYVQNYMSVLLAYDYRQIEQAEAVWNDYLRSNPEAFQYVSADNLVVNGGFEHDVLGWGFDWQYYKRPHVNVAQETAVFHSGSHSLSVSFDGNGIQDFGIFQYVPVKPDTRYLLRAYVRADDIVGSSGPRLSVLDPYGSGHRFYTSDDMLGSTVWSARSGSFTTGPDTHMVEIMLLRNAPYDPIKGSLWLDDVSITPAEGQ
jgi:tetratricopeptide (TPR) repeat protein